MPEKMNKNVLWMSGMLALSLLTACGGGAGNQPASAGHEANGHPAGAAKPAGGHEAEAKDQHADGYETTGHEIDERGIGGHGTSGHETDGHGTSGHGTRNSHGDHDGQGSHGGQGADGQAEAERLKASFSFAPGSAKAGESVKLTVQIADSEGKPVSDFEVNHEKLLHLIIVSRDLSFFKHIHPEYEGNGQFAIDTSFPAGGDYNIFADFVPKGGTAATLSEWVKVEGEAGQQAVVQADRTLVQVTAGKEVELTLSGAKAGEEVTLTFDIRDAQSKEGIANLEPYLGAVGHVVILSADAKQYLHVHPTDERATGPKAQFATVFPKSGVYKIWGQFQHNGQLFTVPFAVEVK